MCLIAFAIGTDPALPLLLAGNRDEFHDRPTDPLHRWPDVPVGLWAGRDRRDGGTWLGISENGRVALLTNVRSAQAGAGARSRGELVTRWLRSSTGVDALEQDIEPGAYGGFNLVVGDLHAGRWTWLCNRDPAAPHSDGASTGLHRQDLAPGVYGLSNAALDTPWPKSVRLKTALNQALPAAGADHSEAPGTGWLTDLQQALADRTPAPELPATGVSADWERALSSPFVQAADRGYGTRSSLVLRVRVDRQGRCVDLHEWTHSPAGWSAAGPVHHHWRG